MQSRDRAGAGRAIRTARANGERYLDDGRTQVKEVDFLALSSGEPLRVALLLPMTDGDKQNPNYLDFYQGFLLGLEKIKTQYGYSVRVDLFNTRQESDRLRTIVDDADFRAARLIVGPVYEEELPAVIGYAEEYAVPVVSPLPMSRTSIAMFCFRWHRPRCGNMPKSKN